ncbi:hypothetical protein FNF27_02783 [Cafeteria roenbergensis]|uniref:Ras-related protein Rab-18 n=1 Tax=Cafeteria roenbergensis TaxID=33653 RepID=A0A5A8CYR8_CAFRO|nr:hypothetical protein FNF29_03157 [Cafeteria roenbergensis]KAA0156931.1 hypothetical protein FNF31_05856 [Cafeteria roenbergensis]KAA0170927.1 hypothetical protein FNF28_01202 [Cafeteria roenbergensis]KAA0175699.1 hypothetical protein FNF27_02783 [Cafeteria roenbergensis]CAE7315310.1 rab18b [Symbiodinium sp. KB8]|mmetsp:Transcript_5593/g.23721  ORF Transcript_5593/g.23721 Transcript_5593/m.23721 type:complete len:227 (+) Transcript_5593:1-681(+)|eukprot:KAA0153342.1 hypothetical protein FNF29_03157 [Cafeteria roenbergensis]
MARAGSDAFDHMIKLLLVGEAGVGKSSILLRFTEDAFDDGQAATIGVDFKVKTVTVGRKRVKVTIWDTAGQERFRTLTSSFYRGAHGVLLVYDVTQPETFEKLEHWLGEIDGFSADGGAHVAKLLIGNKSDLDERRAVAFADGEAWARTQGMLFLETSAKTNTSISQAFEEVIERILETPGLVTASLPAASAAEAPGTASAPSSGDVDIDGGGDGDAGPSGAAGCC